jgi:tetratricopeptide (TPR) repeat protein
MIKKIGGAKTSETAPIIDPQSAADYTQRGWDHYTKKEYFRAESDFLKALELSPDHYDAQYALALTHQASGRAPEAIAGFEKIIALLKDVDEQDHVRALMLTRLARGHINRIKTGQWHLEG